jgi:uncharacterized Zn finger protein|tara:strand:- start:455 stop:664 length:210 start_codon:yes stop_codon:yes gene_type:complete
VKVGDLVRVFGTTQRLQNKIGLIVGRDSKSDTMQMGRDGDFFYTMYYKVVIDGHVYRIEKSNLEKINNG